jgi:hypothetical protein
MVPDLLQVPWQAERCKEGEHRPPELGLLSPALNRFEL